jgi:hypothetical protein
MQENQTYLLQDELRANLLRGMAIFGVAAENLHKGMQPHIWKWLMHSEHTPGIIRRVLAEKYTRRYTRPLD